MNILYISALEGGEYSGPLHSVPKQIQYQQNYDNVYWINLTSIDAEVIQSDLYHYCSMREFSFQTLPRPFDLPDLIIFEEFFKIECCLIARMARMHNIPYIIVPRCQLTEKYFLNKRLKKEIAWRLLFKKFAHNAKSVQFLTQQELFDSKKYYAKNYFVVPNGMETVLFKKGKKDDVIVGTFIGRYSVWQKGLDLLIQAISKVQDKLLENNVVINLYGPNERTGSINEIKTLVEKYGVNTVVNVFGPVYSSEKKNVLENSDFFIHTSRFEGLPMSVLEALSFGLPCLVTPGTNIKDEIEKFHAGWTAEENTVSIANALKKVCEDNKKIQEYEKNALKLAKNYSWDSIAKQSHYEFLKIVGKKRDN